MDPSGMDYTMHQPSHIHHHPHYHNPGGPSSSASASRCPALRAATEQNNFQLSTSSQPRIHYDPVHAHASSRDLWQSRRPQNWQPAGLPPYSQDSLMMGSFPGSTQPNQSVQPHPPLCPIPPMSNASNVPEHFSPTIPIPFQQYRPAMHPAPRLLSQPYQGPGGFASSNPSHSNTQHSSNRPVYRANNGLSTSGSTHSVPAVQVSPSRTSANPMHISQTVSFSSENSAPSQQLPNLLHHGMAPQQNSPTSLPPQTSEPTTQITRTVEESNSRPTSHSPSAPASASTAQQRNNDQPSRMINPVEIRRASTAALHRARRSMTRFSATPPEWLGENAILLRRGDMSLLEFVESFPTGISDGEGQMNGRWRAHGSGKRVASKKALASLQSINIADLPESDRTCVICYNEFGVANPEGINEAPLRLPKCKHVFGDHCIKKWFQESDSCPYCRDKVHSEVQHAPRRSPGGLRFYPPYQVTAPHLVGYQGHDRVQSRDRDASEPGPSAQSAQSITSNSTDRPSTQISNAGTSNQSPSRRFEGNHFGTRVPPWNGPVERRSPPVEYERRRRTRHRARVSPPSSRSGVFGSPTSSGASQTSVRSSSSSRSRSPVEHMSLGVDLSIRQSLTNGLEQYHWNDNPSPNSNQSVGLMRPSPPHGPVFDAPSHPFQSQIPMPTGDSYPDFVPPNLVSPPANEYPSGLPQMRSDPVRFSSPSTGPPDLYLPNLGHTGSNQFGPYQQS
ncbi:hypothetical protein NUW58_g8987 [Xylaria curta]|uniref:Uncharacterized protein n=1 Tax=Xylaria curta TaxID=42375 RepID=A0ACC1N1T0_9PEZI|nr:hypothetical protein NUW58_g8987 [Xylaria curta]